MIDADDTPVDKWSPPYDGDELRVDEAQAWRESLDQLADMIAKLEPLLCGMNIRELKDSIIPQITGGLSRGAEF